MNSRWNYRSRSPELKKCIEGCKKAQRKASEKGWRRKPLLCKAETQQSRTLPPVRDTKGLWGGQERRCRRCGSSGERVCRGPLLTLPGLV